MCRSYPKQATEEVYTVSHTGTTIYYFAPFTTLLLIIDLTVSTISRGVFIGLLFGFILLLTVSLYFSGGTWIVVNETKNKLYIARGRFLNFKIEKELACKCTQFLRAEIYSQKPLS